MLIRLLLLERKIVFGYIRGQLQKCVKMLHNGR